MNRFMRKHKRKVALIICIFLVLALAIGPIMVMFA